MFERPHHQRIAHVLAALDGHLLRQQGCLFGGGTCIALRYGEYRESVDMDFLVSCAAGYRDLRLPALRMALSKAEQAYGPAVLRDLGKSIDRLQARQGWLERCMQAMAMTLPQAVVWQHIRALRKLLNPA